jgi:imidazolonepropionase-like amidohydrolase
MVVALSLFQGVQVARAQEKPIAIVAGTIIDGTGRVLHNQSIVVQGSKIVSVGGQRFLQGRRSIIWAL